MAQRHRSDTVAPYIDGQRRTTDHALDVTDWTSDEAVATVTGTDEATADAAIECATEAAEGLRERPVPQRAAWCEAIAEGVRERETALATTLVREAGKPISRARREVEAAAAQFDGVAGELRSLTGPYRTWTSAAAADTLERVGPLGVVVCRPSAAAPLGTAARQVAPALAAGNSVVVQPAAATPVTASILADIVAETAIPDGAVNVTPAPTSAASDRLVADERVAAVLGTAEDAGPSDHTLTLGGRAPALVCAGADPEAAATTIVESALSHPGPRNPGARILAHESVSDAVVARLDAAMADWVAGDLFESATDLTPLPDTTVARRLDDLVADAVDRGASIVRGGTADGRAYPPTLLADVPAGSAIHDEWTGPVVAVTPVESAAEAVAVANRTTHSRDPSLFAANHDRAMGLAERLDASTVRIDGARSADGVGGTDVRGALTALTRRKRVVH